MYGVSVEVRPGRAPKEPGLMVFFFSELWIILLDQMLKSAVRSASYGWITRNQWILKLPGFLGMVVIIIDCHLFKEYPVRAQKLRRVR